MHVFLALQTPFSFKQKLKTNLSTSNNHELFRSKHCNYEKKITAICKNYFYIYLFGFRSTMVRHFVCKHSKPSSVCKAAASLVMLAEKKK